MGEGQRKEEEKDGRGWREGEEASCNLWELFRGKEVEEEIGGYSKEGEWISEEFNVGELGEEFSGLVTPL